MTLTLNKNLSFGLWENVRCRLHSNWTSLLLDVVSIVPNMYKKTIERKNKTINVAIKHRKQNNRMVNEIKRIKQNKDSKKGNVKMR